MQPGIFQMRNAACSGDFGDYTRELMEFNTALKPLRTNRKDEFDKLEKLHRDLNDQVARLNME